MDLRRLVVAALLVAAFAMPLALSRARAQVPDARPDSFAELSERLMPAVVNVATTQRVAGLGEPLRAPRGSPLQRFNDLVGEEQLQEINSLGSGFVISPDGVIVTNNHVIEAADVIEVIFHDGERLPASIVGRDPATDLAVLRVRAPRAFPYVRWGDSDAARVGEWVIAIGNPFGLGGSVSAGIISARNRNIDAGRYDDFLQTDAAINRGNSGGPLFNLAGEVIGVNTAIVSPTGGSVGVGFATPSDLARSVVDQLVAHGETRRGWLGVRMGALTPQVARRAGLDRPTGALIAAVTDGGPAARGGLRPGDIVLSYNGVIVAEGRNLTRLVADTPEGAAVVVEFLRGGRRMTTTVTVQRLIERRSPNVAARAPQPERGPDIAPTPSPEGVRGQVLAMTMAELDDDTRLEYGVPPDVSGLLVLAVDPDLEMRQGLAAGDVITRIAFKEVATLDDARAIAARAAQLKQAVIVEFRRGEKVSYRAVDPRRRSGLDR